jgi:hypothetical protein
LFSATGGKQFTPTFLARSRNSKGGEALPRAGILLASEPIQGHWSIALLCLSLKAASQENCKDMQAAQSGHDDHVQYFACP